MSPPSELGHPEWRATARLLRRFLPFTKPYRKAIVGACLLMAVTIVADLVQPWPLKVVIDNVLRDKPLHSQWATGLSRFLSHLGRWNLLWFCAAFIILRALIDGLFSYLSNVRMTAISQHVIYDIRRSLFSHVLRLSFPFFDRQRTGDLITRFTADSANIEDMLVLVVGVLLVNGLTVLATLLVMLRLDWQLTLIACAVLPCLFFVNRYFTRRIRQAARERRRKEGDIASLVQEDISLIRVVRAFTRERFESGRFESHAQAARVAGLRSSLLQSRFTPLSATLTDVGTMLVVVVGACGVLRGSLSLGTLIVMMTYLRSLFNPVRQLSRAMNVVTRATVSAERVAEVLDTPVEIADAPGAIDVSRLRGHVQFENVSFAYDAAGKAAFKPPVLREITLDVPAGTTVALVGRTGAGKSTLASLLPRFHDPVSGVVRIDELDVRSITQQSLREQISVVPQEAVLFAVSVWENIAYGSLGNIVETGTSSDELMKRVEAAAIAANAHEFIVRLPDGYNTIIGERGNTLSGGQRQRIAIARAMIRNAPILILDEPTTGLDAESEHLVLEAIDRVKSGRTTFIIAHRLATIRSAGLIVVLEGGKIIESGTHADLYGGSGRYREFVDRQFQFDLAAT